MQTNCGELAQYVARSEEDDGCHERHLSQFGPTLTDARNDEWNPDNTEQEPRTEHEREVNESRANGAEHDLCVDAAASSGA